MSTECEKCKDVVSCFDINEKKFYGGYHTLCHQCNVDSNGDDPDMPREYITKKCPDATCTYAPLFTTSQSPRFDLFETIEPVVVRWPCGRQSKDTEFRSYHYFDRVDKHDIYVHCTADSPCTNTDLLKEGYSPCGILLSRHPIFNCPYCDNNAQTVKFFRCGQHGKTTQDWHIREVDGQKIKVLCTEAHLCGSIRHEIVPLAFAEESARAMKRLKSSLQTLVELKEEEEEAEKQRRIESALPPSPISHDKYGFVFMDKTVERSSIVTCTSNNIPMSPSDMKEVASVWLDYLASPPSPDTQSTLFGLCSKFEDFINESDDLTVYELAHSSVVLSDCKEVFLLKKRPE